MGIYRKIDCRIWNDEKFRKLGDDGQFAFLFVTTHPAMTCLGAMRASLGGLAEERRWKPRRFRDAIEDAMRLGMVEVNESAAFVGVPNFLKYNAPEGPNSVTKAWIRALDMIPECPERKSLIQRCRLHLDAKSPEFKGRLGAAVWDAFPLCTRNAFLDAIEHASPIQEQKAGAELVQKAEARDPIAQPSPGDLPAACWTLELPLWIERELQSLGFSHRSAQDLFSKVGRDGLAPALAKVRGKGFGSPAGILVRRGRELAEEGRAMLAKALDHAKAQAPQALDEAAWLGLPPCLQEDAEIAAAWCLWRALEATLAKAGESGRLELTSAEQKARTALLELIWARHPEGDELRAKAETYSFVAPPAFRERSRGAWLMHELGLGVR